MTKLQKYYKKRSYPGDPFKSYIFLLNPDLILNKIGISQTNADIKEFLYDLYKDNPQDLIKIIKEVS